MRVTFARVEIHLAICAIALLTWPASPAYAQAVVRVREYVNTDTTRRVFLTDATEIAAVEAGAAGAGWQPSGLELNFHSPNPYGIGKPVYRFYSPFSNSHFFTADIEEFNLLTAPDSGWIYANVDFYADVPIGDACPSSRKPVYRYYNGGAAATDRVRRYSPNRTLKATLEADGWVDEDIAFCAVSTSERPMMTHYFRFQAMGCAEDVPGWPSMQTSCVAVRHQAAMPNVYDAVTVYQANAPFPPLTSLQMGNVYSSIGTGNYGDISQRSFVQQFACGLPKPWGMLFLPPGPCREHFAGAAGIYLSGRDRIGSATSIIPSIYLPASAPAAGEADNRLMPWRGKLIRDVEFSFLINVKRLTIADSSSYAYGHPTVGLTDIRSGRRILINITAFSSGILAASPEQDFNGYDFDTGAVIVSTVFRDNPAFGTRISGSAITSTPTPFYVYNLDSFRFRLGPDDIAQVVSRARAIDPLLSGDISDYAVHVIAFKNEVVGNAEIGMRLEDLKLEVFAR